MRSTPFRNQLRILGGACKQLLCRLYPSSYYARKFRLNRLPTFDEDILINPGRETWMSYFLTKDFRAPSIAVGPL